MHFTPDMESIDGVTLLHQWNKLQDVLRMLLLREFRFEHEYKIEYEYDFSIRLQASRYHVTYPTHHISYPLFLKLT